MTARTCSREKVLTRRKWLVPLVISVFLAVHALAVIFSYTTGFPSIGWKIKSYYKNGARRYTYTQGINEYKIWQEWYSNGNKKQLLYKDNRWQIWRAWYPDGKKREEKFFLDQMSHGQLSRWYSTGRKELELHYVLGQLEGKATAWFESGRIAEEAYYVKGDARAVIGYWPNGKKSTEKHMNANDRPDGTCKRWDEQGRCILDGNYLNGRAHGRRATGREDEPGYKVEWYDNGQVTTEGEFKQKYPDLYEQLYARSPASESKNEN